MAEWASDIRARLASLQLSPVREAEIVEELSQHLDEEYEARRAAGVPDDQARQEVLDAALGGGALARDLRPLRQARTPLTIQPGAPRQSRLRDLLQDVRYALGLLRRQPGFAAAAIVTLALGIGANSAIFALVDATLLRPLPLPSPERVVAVTGRTATESTERARVSPNDLRDLKARATGLAALGGVMPNVGGMVMAGRDGTAETIARQWITAGALDALGAPPVAGRYFTAEDDRTALSAVVLSEAFWRSRFDGDPAILGQQVRLDGDAFTVLGVAPDTVQLIGRSDVWALVGLEEFPPRARGARMFHAIGRLKPGVTIAAAEAELASIAGALAREYPDTNTGRGVATEALHAFVIGGDLRQTSLLFVGVVVFVLLICCANVANLLLAHGAARARELSLRAAMGADRRRLIRQLLTESLVLSALGSTLGLAVGAAILQAAPAVVPAGLLPPAISLGVDLRVVAFCAGAALLVGVLFGLAPARQASSAAPAQALAVDSRTTTASGGWLRSLCVLGEVATAVVLLVGAGLLLRTLIAVQTVDRGYRADSVLTMLVDPLASQYPTDDAVRQFYEAVATEVRQLPGVHDAAWASTLPLGDSYAGPTAVALADAPPRPLAEQPTADYQIVSAEYFRALDLPIVEGRPFDARDTPSRVPVCIVNEAFVRRHLGGRPAIGARVRIMRSETAPAQERQIVGVARQVKGRPDEREDFQQVYVPLTQVALDDSFLLVRPRSGSAAALASSVRAAIGRVDRAQLVSVRQVLTLEDVAWEATSRHRFRATLVTAFAGLALLLAMIGLFGTLAYAVQRRVREMGVRRALGATTADVIGVVIRGALPPLAAGTLIGLGLAAALGRLLGGMLVGVAPIDPLTLGSVLAVLAVTAAMAIAAPAWAAARVDPVEALRAE
jgi:putative ABC transport system permease protein